MKLIDQWIAALRSGDYAQATGQLYDPKADGYCCLGVLTHLYNPEHELLGKGAFLPGDVAKRLVDEEGPSILSDRFKLANEALMTSPIKDSMWKADEGAWDIRCNGGKMATVLNDHEKWPFAQIADVIERSFRPEQKEQDDRASAESEAYDAEPALV